MAITASQVNELRQRTGLGMMECKKLLTDAGGDIEKAIETARKMGVKTKVAEREAGEGQVTAFVSDDKKRGVIVEIKCNTDFSAKSEPVTNVLNIVGKKLLADPSTNVTEDSEVKDALVAAGQQTGENVQLGRTVVLEGDKVGKFIYTVTGKIAALVAVNGDVSDEVLSDVGLHLVAAKPTPVAATREGVPAELVRQEREIAVEQAKQTGKPQEIAEKIAEGKMNAFYRERVLTEQEFINPDKFKGSVGELIKKNGGELKNYARVELGLA